MPSTDDTFHLQRFRDAQSTTYTRARSEFAAGQKRSHGMWFIFPQIEGLDVLLQSPVSDSATLRIVDA